MTEFGQAVWVLAARRGIAAQKDLAGALSESGVQVTSDVVRNYLVGRTAVPTRFLHALDQAFDLTEEEKQELAMVYAWGETTRRPARESPRASARVA